MRDFTGLAKAPARAGLREVLAGCEPHREE